MKGGSPNERMIGRMASLIVYVQEGSTDGVLAVANATHEIQCVKHGFALRTMSLRDGTRCLTAAAFAESCSF